MGSQRHHLAGMEQRLVIAYALIALLLLAAAAAVAYARYNTHDRKIARRRAREYAATELRNRKP